MKLAIPALLGIIVLVGGLFAVLPVDEATTVHTTIQNSQQILQTVTTPHLDYNAAQAITITATDVITLLAVIVDDGTADPPTAADNYDIPVVGTVVDGDQVDAGDITAVNDQDVDDALDILTMMDISQLTGTVFAFELDPGNVPVTDGDNLDITIIYLGRGDQTPVITIE